MNEKRKGIVLAGGSGTRLYPATLAVSKQLLPVYDKPMIYYPLATLMSAGIREIAIITTPQDRSQYRRLLGSGVNWGCEFTYIEQPSPDGLAQAYLLAERFLDGAPSALILGDNIFHGENFGERLRELSDDPDTNTVFGYRVSDPERYGVVGYAPNGQVTSIVEKPKHPASDQAVTGLYLLDATAPERAKNVQPSDRGELEIVSVLDTYLKEGRLTVERLGNGAAWFDTGTHDSLMEAGQYVQAMQHRTGQLIGSMDIVSFNSGWINQSNLRSYAICFDKNKYGDTLSKVSQLQNF